MLPKWIKGLVNVGEPYAPFPKMIIKIRGRNPRRAEPLMNKRQSQRHSAFSFLKIWRAKGIRIATHEGGSLPGFGKHIQAVMWAS